MKFIPVLSLFILCSASFAQGPVVPDVGAPNGAADGVIVDQIRDALETGEPAAAPGILGDVLEVIRQRGSILDGSVLDPRNDEPLKTDDGATQNASDDVESVPTAKAASSVVAAESLLRSARLLESIPGGDKVREALIRQMRIQATRLLVQSYPL